jgi:LDH2 family malate/lactate/ureidoglycolate dehydrogenase
MYVRDIKAGTTNSTDEPLIVKESVATALVDGNNLLGPVVGNFCMSLAIKKGFISFHFKLKQAKNSVNCILYIIKTAKEVGIGMVVANRSNHYGMLDTLINL